MHIVLTAQDLNRIAELVKQARTQFSLATPASADTRAYIVYAPYDATFVTITSDERPEGLIFFYVTPDGKVSVAGFGAYMQPPRSHDDIYTWMSKTFRETVNA